MRITFNTHVGFERPDTPKEYEKIEDKGFAEVESS